MFTIFVSHQWLGPLHPDPSGEKLRVLQGFLRNVAAKKLQIEQDVASEIHVPRSGVQVNIEVRSYICWTISVSSGWT